MPFKHLWHLLQKYFNHSTTFQRKSFRVAASEAYPAEHGKEQVVQNTESVTKAEMRPGFGICPRNLGQAATSRPTWRRTPGL